MVTGEFHKESIANDEVIHLSKVQDLMSIAISRTHYLYGNNSHLAYI